MRAATWLTRLGFALLALAACSSEDGKEGTTVAATSGVASSGSGGASASSGSTGGAPSASTSSSASGGSGGDAGNGGSGPGGAGGATPMPPVCGDGLVNAPEQCDDRNTTAGDGCEANCKRTLPVCGDGDVEAGELCDDGPADKCSATCAFDAAKAPVCASAVDLADPKLVMQDGLVTTYAGTTVGGPKAFGTASCTQKSLGAAVRLHRFTAPKRGQYRFETVATPGGLADTVVWAYADCLDTTAAAVCVDDVGGEKMPAFSAYLPKGVSLFVVVGGVGSGAYTLKMTQLSSCGDGALGDGEICDDGNESDGDGCSSKCAPELTVAESEPNDSSATSNLYGVDTLAAIAVNGDADWFTFVIPKGKTRALAGVVPVFGGTCDLAKKSEQALGSVFAEVTLFAEDGVTKIKQSDLYNPCPLLKVAGLTPGTYRLRVAANSKFCPKCLFEYGLHAVADD